MDENNNSIKLTEDEFREIFELFSSPSKFEKEQIYNKNNDHYFKKVNLNEEYELTQSKKEFAMDAWRSVIAFLNSNGYSLFKDKEIINISLIENDFI